MYNKTSVFKDFITYVSRNIFGQMAYSCYTLADTFFVSSRLGANGLTSLNLAFPLFCLLNGTGLMLGMGGGIRYAIVKSRGGREEADQIFTNAILLMLSMSILFVLCGISLPSALAKALGADSTVLPMTETYLKVLLVFAPAFLANNLLQCFVRNDGNPSLSMAAMVCGSLSNVVLDYLFIFPLHMGIFGAALATGLAPVISLTVLLPYFIKKRNGFHFIKSAPDCKLVWNILASGTPSFITEITSGIVMWLFNDIILRLEGNIGVAAFGIITVISLVVVAIYTGLAQGIQPIIGFNHGAGNILGVKTILQYAMITVLFLSVILYLVIFFGASQLAFVFNSEKNPALQAFAVTGLKLYFLACPFIGFNIVAATCLSSTEHPRTAQIISGFRGFFILIPTVFLLSAIWGITGIWFAYPLTEGIVTIIGTVFYFNMKKQNSINRVS